MKKFVHLFLSIVLIAGLAACKQEVLSSLEAQIADLKSNQIASISSQISNIQASISAMEKLDAELKSRIDALSQSEQEQQQVLIQKEAALSKRIDDLKAYVDNELKKQTDWINASFSTMEQYQSTCSEIASIRQDLAGMDTTLRSLIAGTESSIKTWVNDRFTGYYTIAEMDAKVAALEKAISDGDSEQAAELKKLRGELQSAQTDITAAYEKAIADAVTASEGKISEKIAAEIKTATDALQAQIDAITARLKDIEDRVGALEQTVSELIGMVQSVVAIPDYSDGTVRMLGLPNNNLCFEVRPIEAAQRLAEVGASAFSLDYVETITKSSVYNNIPITDVSFDGEVLSVVADGSNLPDAVKSGDQAIMARLCVSDGKVSRCSDFFGMSFLSYFIRDYDTGLYLTFSSEGETTVSILNKGNNAPSLYYSFDKRVWVQWQYLPLTFTKEQPLYICGDNSNGFSTGIAERSQFVTNGSNFGVSGNIMSLVSYNSSKDSVPSNCFYCLFEDCTGLTSAPELPATTLNQYCYACMFSGCTSLTTAPELPATTLKKGCYTVMFSGCTSLNTAPELPATKLAAECYGGMFFECSSLSAAPVLPATKMYDHCYSGMFTGCTGLTTAPELPATSLSTSCYEGMFSDCTGLTSAPILPATTMYQQCYTSMFYGCTSLTAASNLPATALAQHCYAWMFAECSALTTAPSMPATTMKPGCYYHMFHGCSSLTNAPELPAPSLDQYCYQGMFYGCTSLTAAPNLPATALMKSCYKEMFSGCTKLNYIKCLATSISAEDCLLNWVESVAVNGTFVTANGMKSWVRGLSGIPSCWKVLDGSGEVEDYRIKYLTFASEGHTTITLTPRLSSIETSPSLFYSTDKTTWTRWEAKRPVSFTNEKPIYVFGDNPEGFNTSSSFDSYRFSSIGTDYSISGSIMSLISSNAPTSIPSDYCFRGLFQYDHRLTSAPELPATTLTNYCYADMFSGCTSLTTAPELPATTLKKGCYIRMFGGCEQLSYIKCLASDISAEDCLLNWVDGVAANGTFVKNPAATDWPAGACGVPEGWTVTDAQ